MKLSQEQSDPAVEAAVGLLPRSMPVVDTRTKVALARAQAQAPMGWPAALAALAEGGHADGADEAWRLTRRVAGVPGLGRSEALAMAIARAGRPGSLKAAWFDLRRSPTFLRDEWGFTGFLKALRAFGVAQREREATLEAADARVDFLPSGLEA